jgi:hypothetical protein
VLKSRVQQQRLLPKQQRLGVLSAARGMVEEAQGISWRLVRLVFKGYPATAIRGIPVAATVLPVLVFIIANMFVFFFHFYCFQL